jgi:hypothetical protein
MDHSRLVNVSLLVTAFVCTILAAAGPVAAGILPPPPHETELQAVPWVFIAAEHECGDGYPAGSRIVTSAWLGGMGLPDNAGPNFNLLAPADAPNKHDPHRGLLLSKNGATPICASAGADITGVEALHLTVTLDFALGFDYRNGGHCGGGAPRFNVVVVDPMGVESFHFVGSCAVGVNTPASQDPAEWTRVRWTAAMAFPPIPLGSTVKSVSIVYDEGTDSPSPVPSGDAAGVGLAVIDNIFVAGRYIRTGSGIADGH